ncbi:AraC family transcriptional regulator ligand-binding domain-containing protein [Mucilaginibacter sp. 21P]|uniref:AraC family transcriptional regulator n=1 Tax=Mucilaginibacter sp. 21P TaxID=2778902 RepID=UPI001C5725AF|nr:AraC family transcriptional regulator [Mucilaginibacter sp. 21P]QXV66779.1 AraC family transcriptional regulator ligand-binding domain-containing protein [Mucilaginibacter sp. 21P]
MNKNFNVIAASMIAYFAYRELPSDRLCRSAGIDKGSMFEDATMISEEKIRNLWVNAVKLSNDLLFGLHFGESLQLSALGIVGELIKTSRDVGTAITAAANLISTITPLFRMEMCSDEIHFVIKLLPTERYDHNDPVCGQIRDFLTAFTIHELDGLTLKKIRPVSVIYPADKSNVPEYERVLRCKPSIGDHVGITFEIQDWDMPIITSNYELQQLLLQSNATVKDRMSSEVSFKNKVTNYMLSNAYLGLPSIEQLSSNFNISSRTLQRKLSVENSNFQQITDNVLKRLAISYLKEGSHTLKEIAYMLGYNDPSAFSRAFKKWTGFPPATYQRNEEH